ncbi:SMI1/KNR4 family protein [Nocardia sp. CA-084685]|uniref:SMI1/KNR4 family protein n=1 Tax=Nocardia sp. CA-084685 TaxID=3239970 RepID=UPI003D95F421
MIESAVQRAVENMIANAPAGWTAAVSESNALVSYIVDGRSVPYMSKDSLGSLRIMQEDMRAIAAKAKESNNWEKATITLTCDPTGEYRLVAVQHGVMRTLGSSPGYLAVIDPTYEMPWPGDAQDAGASDAQGDPELALQRFHEYLQRRATILGRPDQLRPPVSAAALAAAERRIGQPLPADLRALYLYADGEMDSGTGGLFGGKAWMPLETVVATLEEERDLYATMTKQFGWHLAWDWVVLDAQPPETVRRCGGHPGWIPIGTNLTGNYMAVDMAPARHGHPGQVILTGRDYSDGPAYVADSVTSLLGHYLSALDLEQFEIYRPGDVISISAPDYETGPKLLIGGTEILDDVTPSLQLVTISGSSPIDLAPLAAAPNLRRLYVRCPVRDLAPIRHLPIESLHINLANADLGDLSDLSDLSDHRTLTSLAVQTMVSVDITPLRTVSTLRGLDLSKAEVRDLKVLADLPELRYLALRPYQWEILLDQGKLPATLAAAQLIDNSPSLDEAVAWSQRLGIPTGEVFRLSGQLR